MLQIQTLHLFDTEYSADSVEFQIDSNFFVVGTYQLEENNSNSTNVRKGRIYLFFYDNELNELKKCHQIETDAILDQKWKNETILTATSSGSIRIFQLKNDDTLINVQEIILSQEKEKENLALCIDIQKTSSKVIASDSKGRLSLVDLEGAQPSITQWEAHKFESWTCAFDNYNESIVYSGGDDSVLNVWDIRSGFNALKLSSASRDSGVTSFSSFKENKLLVGGYDEKLCVYDLRNLKSSTDEINLNGGVWRIKPCNNLILVACMYHNFSIIEFEGNLKLVGEYFEHKSICYGCDWSPLSNDDCKIFASCSFYDHKLSLCKIKF